MSTTQHRMPKSHAEARPKRVFSLPEANRALVLVRRIVTDVIFEYARMIECQEGLEVAEAEGTGEQRERARMELINSAGRLRSCLDELEVVGVELKDWSLGVVDFPSFAAGREVCLCWQYGQDRVEFWHEVDADHGARQPIDALPGNEAYFQDIAARADAK